MPTLSRSKKIETTKVIICISIFKMTIVMIKDTHDCVKFLNKLPLGVLEESLSVFRENLFSMSDRKRIPILIYEILQKEYKLEK